MSAFESHGFSSHTVHVHLWQRVGYFKHVLLCDHRRLSAVLEQKLDLASTWRVAVSERFCVWLSNASR